LEGCQADFANLSAHSPPTVAAKGPQKAVYDSSPHPVDEVVILTDYTQLDMEKVMVLGD
jgi:hypothetical protein